MLDFTSSQRIAVNPAAICFPSAAGISHMPALLRYLWAGHLCAVCPWDTVQSQPPACAASPAVASAVFSTLLSLSPNCSATSRCVFPPATIPSISGINIRTCVYSRFLMTIPPDVVYFPTSGGILSLSVFTGPVQWRAQALVLYHLFFMPPSRPGAAYQNSAGPGPAQRGPGSSWDSGVPPDHRS